MNQSEYSQKENLYASFQTKSSSDLPGRIVSALCCFAVCPDFHSLPPETKGISAHSRHLSALCPLLLCGRSSLWKGAAHPAVFLGNAHWDIVFSGTLSRIHLAEAWNNSRTLPSASRLYLLRSRRHDWRHFKLTHQPPFAKRKRKDTLRHLLLFLFCFSISDFFRWMNLYANLSDSVFIHIFYF